MRSWVIGLLSICMLALLASLVLNAILMASYPVEAQPEPEIVYVTIEPQEARTGHVGLFVRHGLTGEEVHYQVFWAHGEHWVSANSQPVLCGNVLDSRSTWLSMTEWQQRQIREICEVTK